MIDVDYNPELEAYQFMNLGRARIRGIELKCKATLLGGLIDTQIGATLLDPINLDTQKTLSYRAKTNIVWGTSLHYKKWTLGMDYRYASRVEEIIHVLGSEFDERVPTRVMDVRLITDIGNISIGLEGKNILNYHYTLRQRFLEPIRHYVMTLRGTF
jgi:outer membrane cobalamin receptor